MSDPVAAKSTFLCMYMSSHPDTLVSYVKFWGKVQDHVTSASMTAIDTKGMTLTYKTKASGDSKKEVRVDFNPPLAGYEDVKPRLMNMKADADEALGVTRAPQITNFQLPLNTLISSALIGSLVYVTFAPLSSSPSYSPLYLVANIVRDNIPTWFVKSCWIFVGVTHALEALYTYSLCKKHRTGIIVGAQYVVATFIFGFPIWMGIRRQVQAARIDSIMKGQ